MTDLSTILATGSVCLVASVCDLKHRKIPNGLPVALLGLAALSVYQGALSAMSSAAGLALAFACTLPPYLARGLGGGDVKFASAAGALVGFEAAPKMLLGFVVAAGIAGVVSVLLHPNRSAALLRLAQLRYLPSRGLKAYRAPPADDPGKVRLPMAPAISLATLWALLGGNLFDAL